jgi:hypothetical protein
MAKMLVFRYPCGWEYSIRMLRGQTKLEATSRFGWKVRKIHRRVCETCSTSQVSSTRPRSDTSTHI